MILNDSLGVHLKSIIIPLQTVHENSDSDCETYRVLCFSPCLRFCALYSNGFNQQTVGIYHIHELPCLINYPQQSRWACHMCPSIKIDRLCLHSIVNSLYMFLQMTRTITFIITLVAGERFFSRMLSSVYQKVILLYSCIFTHITFEGFQSCVFQNVACHSWTFIWAVRTKITLERLHPHSWVWPHVNR